jgi:hypothetical protein
MLVSISISAPSKKQLDKRLRTSRHFGGSNELRKSYILLEMAPFSYIQLNAILNTSLVLIPSKCCLSVLCSITGIQQGNCTVI